MRQGQLPRPPDGADAARRTDWRGGTPPDAVQPMATLRQNAPTPRRSTGMRRRDLQLQPRLRARNDGSRSAGCRAAGLSALRRPRTSPAILPRLGETDWLGLADGSGL